MDESSHHLKEKKRHVAHKAYPSLSSPSHAHEEERNKKIKTSSCIARIRNEVGHGYESWSHGSGNNVVLCRAIAWAKSHQGLWSLKITSTISWLLSHLPVNVSLSTRTTTSSPQQKRPWALAPLVTMMGIR